MHPYLSAIEKHRALILEALDYIWKNPETGYREWKTHAYLKAAYEKLGYILTEAGNIPGFTAELDTGKEGPTIAVFGEMDSLIVPSHPEADPETKAVHACGHCAQSAALLGLAAALKEPDALAGLCGKIRLVAVPAEELIELEFRAELRKQGIIRYFGGKPEFLRRGLLDGVDMAFMLHTTNERGYGFIGGGANGMIGKSVVFEGVSAHAGGAPHQGVNALYAANLAMNAVNALRETFRDADHIRFHPIITKGGDAVNAIPEEVRLETYVRGASMKEILAVNYRINRAIAASAAAIGAKAKITDHPGYYPLVQPEGFCSLLKEAFEPLLDKVNCAPQAWSCGSTDMGDISAVMPALHPYIGGGEGTLHGNDFRIGDPDTACIRSAAVQLNLLHLLLEQDAAKAKALLADFTPDFASFEEYFAAIDAIDMDQQTVCYDGDEIHLSFGKAPQKEPAKNAMEG